MRKLSQITLRESQLAALDILKQVKKICDKINIQYWAVFGTLLGAIRHQGFIPWDDDLDIAMKKEDYDKFVSYFQEYQDELYPLVVHNKESVDNCFYNITRICDERYILEFDDYHYQSGVFIDIYAFEGMGNKSDISYWNKKFRKMNRYKKCVNMSCSKTIFYGDRILHKILNLPLCIYAKSKGSQYFFGLLDSYKKFDWDSSEYVGIPRWEPFIYRNFYDSFSEVKFEDTMICIPNRYREILEEVYDEYMLFPPEEERKPHHAYKAYKRV